MLYLQHLRFAVYQNLYVARVEFWKIQMSQNELKDLSYNLYIKRRGQNLSMERHNMICILLFIQCTYPFTHPPNTYWAPIKYEALNYKPGIPLYV